MRTSRSRILLLLFLPALGAVDSGWPHYAGDPAASRYSPLRQIDRGNVQRLETAWVFHAGHSSDELKTTIECNPLVIRGVMYLVSPILEVIALDAATGKQIWRYDPFPGESPLASASRWPLAMAVSGSAALALLAVYWLRFRPRTRTAAMTHMLLALLVTVGAQGFGWAAIEPFSSVRHQERRQGPVRGLTYYENGAERRIYFAGGSRLVALRADTGAPITTFGDRGVVHLRAGMDRDLTGLIYTATSPGVIFQDLFILGIKVGEGPHPSAPGHIRAFDIHTGKQRWIFHTIPYPGEPGYETWPPDAWKSAGGANAWGGVTLDESRGLVFASTGSPTFDLYGGDRVGSNLYGNSVLALRADSGKLVWHYQVVHHDLWDYDLPAPPSLLRMTAGGRPLDVAVQVGKNGYIYVLDRETGKPVFPVEERPVPSAGLPGERPWPTQPIPVKPPPLARTRITPEDLSDLTPAARQFAVTKFRAAKSAEIYAPPSKQETIVTPGFHGGGNWSGASFDPVRSLLVVASNDIPYLLTMRDARPWAKYQYGFTGFLRFRDAEGYPAVKPPWGLLTAIDLNRAEVVWKVPFGEDKKLSARGIPPTGMENAGGVIVTGGGLIFAGATSDEMFRALDIDSGRVLWETKLPAAGYALPSTYAVNGRQYVVIAAGGGAMIDTRTGDSYIAFALPQQ